MKRFTKITAAVFAMLPLVAQAIVRGPNFEFYNSTGSTVKVQVWQGTKFPDDIELETVRAGDYFLEELKDLKKSTSMVLINPKDKTFGEGKLPVYTFYAPGKEIYIKLTDKGKVEPQSGKARGYKTVSGIKLENNIAPENIEFHSYPATLFK